MVSQGFRKDILTQ